MSDAVLELERARRASRVLATAGTEAKNAALHAAADLLVEHAAEVLGANGADLDAATAGGMEQGPLDRLRLTASRIDAMAAGLRQVAALTDPVGEIVSGWVRPNGLEIQQVRVPLGVVAIIYESATLPPTRASASRRGTPLVAGERVRGCVLDLASAAALRAGFAKAGLPEDAVILVDDPSYDVAVEVMQLTDYVDCLIPRGGAGHRAFASMPRFR